MIIDSLKNTKPYEHIHPLIKKAFDYIKSVDFSITPVGRIELEGDRLYIMVSDSDLKTETEAKLEVHNEYIDIQIPVSKPERFGWSSRAALTEPIGAFDTNKDILFFEDKPESYITVSPGKFLIFFTGDAHAPCIGTGSIRKAVVKIKL
ncbi:YhcH/YjgK/YiaL family protein [Dysgonomonas sp. 25]|uniref:YhcH/YjgK/YiaL family protein n=1 Tax=Dysgonomonas sp. 25 TaxID=2302933 RepID=UPI0013CFD12F|nr:YhcH/YjgK/YiaL family protein [Dysgonomonas sp. 25]NDV69089.1 DUF386 domain-containing protein [Dysgonomonas sp. 25]